MKEYKPFKSGKVREVYDAGDSIIMVATDRISAFDHILQNKITQKGEVLTKMSKFWFDLTADILPNHMISIDNNDMPEFFQQDEFKGNSMKCKKLTMIPMECIVRGYITGSGWESYKKDGTICGIKLPEGLKESDKLHEPIFTPSTKAEIGDHDENVSFEQGIEYVEKVFPGKGREYVTKIRDYTIAIYKKCADYAREHGIIIADTKFEFGLDENGNIVAVHCTYDPESRGGETPDGRKVKGTSHWVSAKYNIKAEVRQYDKLFKAEIPGASTGNYLDDINPDSLIVLKDSVIEEEAKNAKVGDYLQFVRNGYYCVDCKDSTPEHMVFNRTVTLKDSWSKMKAKMGL